MERIRRAFLEASGEASAETVLPGQVSRPGAAAGVERRLEACPEGGPVREVYDVPVAQDRLRALSAARALSITLRTVHLASFGLLLGGHALDGDPERLLPYLYGTVASGAGLIALELRAAGVQWLFLGKGLAVLVKLAILVAVPFLWEVRVPLLLLVVVIASIGSHMPGRYRHYSVLHGRVVE